VPGLGLFLLRSVLGVTFVIHGIDLLHRENVAGTVWATSMAGVLCGLMVFVGLLTPFASVILCAATIGDWAVNFPPGQEGMHLPSAGTICTVIVTVAVALLGPGAYSADARMFGRREVVVSKALHESDD
jgi:uncharacterized membrane protein YphA (DoxX/SURF4 family)